MFFHTLSVSCSSFCVVCLSLQQDYLACSSDLQEVLQQDPNVQEAEKELEEVTVLLRQSLADASPAKPRRIIPISEVETYVIFNECFKLGQSQTHPETQADL